MGKQTVKRTPAGRVKHARKTGTGAQQQTKIPTPEEIELAVKRALKEINIVGIIKEAWRETVAEMRGEMKDPT